MVNVDKTAADLTIDFPKVKAADRTTTAVVFNAPPAGIPVALVFVLRDLLDGALTVL